MEEDRPTPEELAGFGSALAAVYNSMVDGTPMLKASLGGKLYDAEHVCDLIEKRNDTMSDDHYACLRNMAARVRSTDLTLKDRTYAAGARCLRSLIGGQRRLETMRAQRKSNAKPSK